QVEPDDREGGADDRVRPRAPPQHHQGVGTGVRGRDRHPERLAATRSRSVSATAIGMNSAPAADPATNRKAKRARLGAGSGGAGGGAGEGPGRALTPLIASAYGARRSRYQSGASSATRTSSKPAASIHARYSSTA